MADVSERKMESSNSMESTMATVPVPKQNPRQIAQSAHQKIDLAIFSDIVIQDTAETNQVTQETAEPEPDLRLINRRKRGLRVHNRRAGNRKKAKKPTQALSERHIEDTENMDNDALSQPTHSDQAHTEDAQRMYNDVLSQPTHSDQAHTAQRTHRHAEGMSTEDMSNEPARRTNPHRKKRFEETYDTVEGGNPRKRKGIVTINPPKPRRTSPSKHHHFRKNPPGVTALKEIRRYQKGAQLLIKRHHFQKCVKDIVEEKKFNVKFQSLALLALQEAAENHVTGYMEETQLFAIHAKRVTIMKKDMDLVREMRRRYNVL